MQGTENRAIHFTVHGDGPPLVLGHSFLCSGSMWAPQIEPLAERCKVVNIDARGHGKSTAVDRDFTLYDMVADVTGVMDELGIERAVWGGLSVGGMVALRAALTVPDRVSALVLLDTDAGSENWHKRFRYGLLGRVARMIGIGPIVSQIAKQMFGQTTLRENRELVANWKQELLERDLSSMLRMLSALQTRDCLLARLPEIEVPTLVICGAEDIALPSSRSRRIADAIPHARYVEIPAAGHLATLEQPPLVTSAMLEFLESL